MPNDKTNHCQMCGRRCALTFHHLIPRKLHRRNFFKKNYSKEQLQNGVMLCTQCHRGIHNLFSEMELAKHLNTLELLKNNSQVQRHAAWVAKQKIT